MADAISKITVADNTYDIKDATARGSVTTLEGRLGGFAFVNEGTGSVTPSGTVTAPTVTVTPSSKSVKVVNNAGTLPSWGASVSNETLTFSWSAGALTTTSNQTVLTGITDATATQPVFSGTASTVTVTPKTN